MIKSFLSGYCTYLPLSNTKHANALSEIPFLTFVLFSTD